MKEIYFDNAASTPLHPEVIQVMKNTLDESIGNPSSIHNYGRKARTAIEKARKTIAAHLQASIGEIFFTSGGTESNNMAIKCAVRDLGVERIISSPIEHHCVLHSIQRVQKNEGIQIEFVELDEFGKVKMYDLQNRLGNSDKRTLVSLMHANNEIGTLLDIEAVSALCKENGAFFHSDTVQTIGHFPLNLHELDIHFISGSAHKFHGPKGVGFIYINNESLLQPFIDGGAQERNMRGGTENVYGIVGMAKALDLAVENMEEDKAYIESIRSHMKETLEKKIKGISFNGAQDEDHLYTVLNVQFPPHPKSDTLLMHLDMKGIAVSGGSACSSGADQGSHVIRAIHPDPEGLALRFSFSKWNTKEEVDHTINTLTDILD